MLAFWKVQIKPRHGHHGQVFCCSKIPCELLFTLDSVIAPPNTLLEVFFYQITDLGDLEATLVRMAKTLDPNLHHEQNQEGITKVKPNTCSNGHSFSQNASLFFLFFFFFFCLAVIPSGYPSGITGTKNRERIAQIFTLCKALCCGP